jgi:hypothetical protein
VTPAVYARLVTTVAHPAPVKPNDFASTVTAATEMAALAARIAHSRLICPAAFIAIPNPKPIAAIT